VIQEVYTSALTTSLFLSSLRLLLVVAVVVIVFLDFEVGVVVALVVFLLVEIFFVVVLEVVTDVVFLLLLQVFPASTISIAIANTINTVNINVKLHLILAEYRNHKSSKRVKRVGRTTTNESRKVHQIEPPAKAVHYLIYSVP